MLQAAAKKFGLDSGFWALLNNLDFGMLGYGIVGLFVLTWAFSLLI
jgi:high-affinity nickel permease